MYTYFKIFFEVDPVNSFGDMCKFVIGSQNSKCVFSESVRKTYPKWLN